MSYAQPVRQGTGWLLFSSVLMIGAGVMRILDGLWAFSKDDEISKPIQTLFWDNNLDAYGWLWLIVGILLVAAGFSLLNGAQWARWFGIFAASVAAISAMTWIYAYPIWSFVSILIAILVIYGLTMYGGRDAVDY
jgi:hypothetical protein